MLGLNNIYKNFIKRFLDIVISLILLILLSPILIIVSIMIYIKIGLPIFFIQERPGLNETKFKLIKFRTMENLNDKNGDLLPDNQRLTKFGAFLRSTSLDELPELYNILKGDMSFIGPRPLLSEYLPLYNEEQKKRHNVRPGLTGLAQINGRNLLTWNEKFKLDIFYIHNINFLLDLKIFLKTFYIVIKRDGISSKQSITMEKFKGNN